MPVVAEFIEGGARAVALVAAGWEGDGVGWWKGCCGWVHVRFWCIQRGVGGVEGVAERIEQLMGGRVRFGLGLGFCPSAAVWLAIAWLCAALLGCCELFAEGLDGCFELFVCGF